MPRALLACLTAVLVGLLAVAPSGEAARGKQAKAKKASRGSAVLGSGTLTLKTPKRKRRGYGQFRSLTRAPKASAPVASPVTPAAAALPVATPALPSLPDPVVPPPEPLGSFASVRARDSATNFSFTLSRPVLAAGAIRLQLQNSGEDPHDLTVEPASGGTQIATTSSVAPGANASLATDLPAGSYRLYCSLYDHAARGMQVTLDVR